MKAISTGKEYRIYSDHLKVYDKLPAASYIVRFSKLQGFFLEEYSDIEINEEKIYGVLSNKVNKAINTFKQFNRNLGIILSGDKGMGKSLYAKLVSYKAIENGYPLIVVDQFVPGINSFIEEIEQEVVVLFDEFDKMLNIQRRGDEAVSLQDTLLSLLDGIPSGKKMYIITCNNLHGLNDYFVNRPGRFHYHFRFDYPTNNEIKLYLQDKLDKSYWDEIKKVISFADKIDINYDCLRSIAFEIQNGESFETAIQDLNIINLEEQKYNIMVYFSDGTTMVHRNCGLNLFDRERNVRLGLYNSNGNSTYIYLEFITGNAEYQSQKGCFVVPKDKFKVFWDKDDEECDDNIKVIKDLTAEYVTIKRLQSKGIHYTV